MTTLTGHGADCVLLCKDSKEARRFCDSLTDAREINEHHGRAAVVEGDIAQPSQTLDAISRCAEVFGGIDVFIDGHLVQFVDPLQKYEMDAAGTSLLQQTMLATLLTTQGALKFLEGRTKGRMIFLVHNEEMLAIPGQSTQAFVRGGVSAMARALTKEMTDKPVQINCIAMGLTEEYLQKRFPKSPSIQAALTEFQKIVPAAKIQDPQDIANAIVFVASPLSSAFPGRTF